MVITRNILDQKLISFSEAARKFPGCDGAPHVAPTTIWRWKDRGCRAADGTIVKLKAIRAGSRWFTTKEAVEEFIEALSRLPGDSPAVRTPAQTRKASETAEAELRRLGV